MNRSAADTTGAALYETDQAVGQYLEFHYGPPALGVANFPQACIDRLRGELPEVRRRACDLGCAVGRSAFELARHFERVDAFDYSAAFIAAAKRLQDRGLLGYRIPVEGAIEQDRQVSLATLGLAATADRVFFAQADACRLGSEYTDYDLVFAGNLIDRLYEPAAFLAGIGGRILPGGLLAITSPYTWLEDYTPRSRWLGGYVAGGNPVTTFEGIRRVLGSGWTLCHRQDVPFVIRETARKHQHTIADFTLWRHGGP
jgi:putative 4-mercaptohistidine N1-methyltranferase